LGSSLPGNPSNGETTAVRRKTRQVSVSGVRIGGEAPIALQTMTAGYPYEVDKCIAEVRV